MASSPDSRGVQPSSKNIANIKATLLRPATTSHFMLDIPLQTNVSGSQFKGLKNFLDSKIAAGAARAYDRTKMSLLCAEAALPGSSLATHEINNNYTGVTERHAYRRLYDDRASFTFYVDTSYDSITFFETWMQYVAGEEFAQGLDSSNYNYRFNFPGNGGQGYRCPEISLSKFEKDYDESGSYLQYRFLNAFPIGLLKAKEMNFQLNVQL